MRARSPLSAVAVTALMLGLGCRPAAAVPVAAATDSCVPNAEAVFTDTFHIDRKTGIASATIAVRDGGTLCQTERVTLAAYRASGTTRQSALPQVLTAAKSAEFVKQASLSVQLEFCGPYQVDLIWGDKPLARIDRLWEHGGPDYAPSDLVSLSGRAIDLGGPSYEIGERPCTPATTTSTTTTTPATTTTSTTTTSTTTTSTTASTTAAPATTVASPPSTTAAAEVASLIIENTPTLPVTGADPSALLAAGVMLVMSGALLTATALRRSRATGDRSPSP